MSGWNLRVRARKTSLILGLAGGVLSISCSEDETTGPTAPPEASIAATQALAFNQLAGGWLHTCGITTDNRMYCWGSNDLGQLGDGSNDSHLTPFPVAGTLRFRQVSAGESYTCGVTTDYRAYCWGQNFGALGDGTLTRRLSPVPVAGGHRFRQVDAGQNHTCGVSYPDNRAYCWPAVPSGSTNISLVPVAVSGGLLFKQVSAGGEHSCGVTTADKAYCWGVTGTASWVTARI